MAITDFFPPTMATTNHKPINDSSEITEVFRVSTEYLTAVGG